MAGLGQVHTYSLHACMRLPVDARPEHVSSKDILFALDNKQRVPKLCVVTIHLL